MKRDRTISRRPPIGTTLEVIATGKVVTVHSEWFPDPLRRGAKSVEVIDVEGSIDQYTVSELRYL